jgi:hypothetical protein
MCGEWELFRNKKSLLQGTILVSAWNYLRKALTRYPPKNKKIPCNGSKVEYI